MAPLATRSCRTKHLPVAAIMNDPQRSPADAQQARGRRTLWLALAHALLAVVILAAFVYVQTRR